MMLLLFAVLYLVVYIFYMVKKKYIMKGLSCTGVMSWQAELLKRFVLGFNICMIPVAIILFVLQNIAELFGSLECVSILMVLSLIFFGFFIFLSVVNLVFDFILKCKYLFTSASRLSYIVSINSEYILDEFVGVYSINLNLNILKDVSKNTLALIKLEGDYGVDVQKLTKRVLRDVEAYKCKKLIPGIEEIEIYVNNKK